MVNKLQEIMGWEFFCVVGFDLGPLLQGQMRIAKLKSAYNSLIIGPRGLEWKTNLNSLAGNLLVWSDLTFGPLLLFFVWSDLTLDPLRQGQTRIAKLKKCL